VPEFENASNIPTQLMIEAVKQSSHEKPACTYNTALCSHFGFVVPLPEGLEPCISERLVLELWRLAMGIAMLRPKPPGGEA
jgi:hypothetical protein